MNNHNVMFLIRGVSGSGKSWFAQKLLEALIRCKVPGCIDSVLFETDDFWTYRGSYDFDIDLLEIAHNWNLGRVCKHCRDFKNSPIIVANTFCEWKEMHPYYNVARKFNRELVILEMTNEPGCIWKSTGKVAANIHNVPENALHNQFARFEHGIASVKVNQDNWETVVKHLIKVYRTKFGK